MAFWEKLFGKNKDKDQQQTASEHAGSRHDSSEYQLPWVQPNANPWNIRLLDLRPISQQMISSSKDPRMATNAISYNQEDGLIFLNQPLKKNRSIEVQLSFPVDHKLEPGVLFIPSTMENKWAIYFHENKILFIRSWLREVFVVAETVTTQGTLKVLRAHGEFTMDESPAMTQAILKFLIHSHVLKEMVPAPIPEMLSSDTDKAGLWAFSTYGNMAHFGYFDSEVKYEVKSKLRSHSLLHIAVARAALREIETQLANGINIDCLAADGLSALQWAMVADIQILRYLLERGANPNVESAEGATPIMNAAQSNKIDHLKLLIQYKADLNRRDHRGFTALHRAAEMGHAEIVQELLNQGADTSIVAGGHTALTLAEGRNNLVIIQMLQPR